MIAKPRPWHFHPEGKSRIVFKVYRGSSCQRIPQPKQHGKLVGRVRKIRERSWEAELFSHIAERPTLRGKGRTRHEAVADAIASGGIPGGVS